MRLLVTRPLPEATATAGALRARGHIVLVSPMLHIRPVRFALPETRMQAVAVTSLNGVRALKRVMDSRRFAGNVFAVGPRTADAAQAAGFGNVLTPDPAGGVAVLADFILTRARPEGGEIVHIAGADMAGDLAGTLRRAGLQARAVTAYRAEPATSLSAPAARALSRGAVDAVLLYSPRTAQAFFRCVDRLGADDMPGDTRFLCLSDAVAAMIPDDIDRRAVVIAERPDEPALFALLEPASPQH